MLITRLLIMGEKSKMQPEEFSEEFLEETFRYASMIATIFAPDPSYFIYLEDQLKNSEEFKKSA